MQVWLESLKAEFAQSKHPINYPLNHFIPEYPHL